MSGRLTNRDKEVYNYMIQTRLPIQAIDMAKMFYLSDTRNIGSATTIQNRRCKVMMELGYIERMSRSFGSQSVYYIGNKPNPKTLRHKLLMSSTLAEICTNGFDVDFKSCKTEVQLMEGLRCDMTCIISYNNKKYCLIIEIGTSHPIDEQKYKIFIEKAINKEIRFPHQLLILNVSDYKVNDEFVKKCITTVKTDFSDFSRFVYNFIVD